MDPNLIRHGFAREVFFCPVADNAIAFLRGDHQRVRYKDLPSVESVGQAALARWVIPRAARVPGYRDWRAEQFLEMITSQAPEPTRQPMGAKWIGRRTS